jgi:hypothetical protein
MFVPSSKHQFSIIAKLWALKSFFKKGYPFKLSFRLHLVVIQDFNYLELLIHINLEDILHFLKT